MKRALFFLITVAIAFTFMACSSPKVTFNYLLPAEVPLPNEIQTIVVVDHSAPKNMGWDILEGGLTGEGIGQDREGVLNLIGGIKEIGAQSNRYELEKEPQRYGKGKLLENIPEPMDLALIKSIGKKHNADAVLSIDKFDSDFITTNARIKDKKDPEDTTKRIPQYQVTGIATVKAYIRVYEVKTGNILDEIKHTDEFRYNATANSVDAALRQLIAKQRAVNNVSYRAGLAYGRRIAPTAVTVTRKIHKRPKNKSVPFDRAVRKAEVADWYGAIEDFKEATKGMHQVKGKAAYNLAVCYEVIGELENAKAWAQDAYIKYGFKDARNYQRILEQRIFDRNELIRQMEPVEENGKGNAN
ncbi:MAG: hypothetical protein JXQ87_05435 [Bacteroidia bacterium]